MPWIQELVQEFLDAFIPFIMPLVRLSLFTTTVALGVWGLITWAWATAFAMIQNILTQELPQLQGQLVVYWTFINRFVPLSESVAMSIIILNVWGSVVVIRWVKSIIPTLSN